MLNISVRLRLIALVLGMAALLLLVGGLGFHASSSAVQELKEIYEHQTIPMREVARLRRLHVENESHVFKAFQHNPSYEYVKLHDHPVSVHIDAIEKNLNWADETWASLFKTLAPDSPEAKLAKDIQPLYSRFINEAGLCEGSLILEKNTSYKKGDLVRHKIFGAGRVEGVSKSGREFKLLINFGGNKREILASFVEKL